MVPLFCIGSWYYEGSLLSFLSIRLNGHLLNEHRDFCSSLYEADHTQTTIASYSFLDELAKATNNSLSSPLELWQIFIGAFLCTAVAVVVLLWFEKVKRGKNNIIKLPKFGLLNIFRLTLIILLIAPIYMTVKQIWLTRLGERAGAGFMLELTLLIMVGAPLESLWFAMIFRAGTSLSPVHLNDQRGSGNNSLFELTLKVFPVFLFFNAVQAIFWGLYFIPFGSSYERLSDFLSQIKMAEPYKNLFAWAFFPLPFIVAKNNIKFRESFKWLYGTWRHHFLKLIILLIIIVTVSSSLNLISALYEENQISSVFTYNYNECMRSFTEIAWPDFTKMGISAIRVVFKMILFLLVARTFSSGTLDFHKLR